MAHLTAISARVYAGQGSSLIIMSVALVTRSVDGSQVLLPLWYRLTKAEVMAYSPSLADKLARSTGGSTLEEIAAEIAEVVSAATRAVA